MPRTSFAKPYGEPQVIDHSCPEYEDTLCRCMQSYRACDDGVLEARVVVTQLMREAAHAFWYDQGYISEEACLDAYIANQAYQMHMLPFLKYCTAKLKKQWFKMPLLDGSPESYDAEQKLLDELKEFGFKGMRITRA